MTDQEKNLQVRLKKLEVILSGIIELQSLIRKDQAPQTFSSAEGRGLVVSKDLEAASLEVQKEILQVKEKLLKLP